MIPLKKENIKRSFDINYYGRGQNYQQQGRVSQLKLTEGKQFVHITASVKGSGRNNYTANVDIRWHNESAVMSGFCSCPISYQCKHVIAICLEYAHLSSAKTPIEASQETCFEWLDALSSVQPPIEPVKAMNSNDEFVAYLIKPSSKKTILSADFVISRLLKSGKSFAKGRPLDAYELTFNYSNSYITEADKRIGNLLKACEGRWGKTELAGEAGYLALQHIIDTGRAFWETTKGEQLTHGSKREITSKWTSNKAGNRTLKIKIKPDANILLTDPPLYIDPVSLEVGLLKGSISLYQLNHLLKAPAIPKSLQKEVSRQLLTRFPDLPIPPLVKIKTREITDTKPTPLLRIYGEDPSYPELSNHLCLRFIYEEIEVSASGSREWSTVEQDDIFWRIQHDVSSESSFKNTLQNLGMEQLNEQTKKPDILLSPSRSKNKLEAITYWQHFLETAIPALKEQGWNIIFEPDFKLEFLATEDDWHINIDEDDDSTNDWFDLRFDLSLAGENQDKIPLLPLVIQLLTLYEDQELPETVMLPLDDHRYIPVHRDKIQPILNILYELYESHSINDESIRLSRHDAARLHQLDKNNVSA